MWRHCSLLALACLCASSGAAAADISVVGLFPGKAVLVVNGGQPRTLTVGKSTDEGIKLIAVDSDEAVVDVEGKRHRLRIGEQVYSGGSGAQAQRVTLTADAQGHFVTTGTVNGATMRFLVDTGATTIALGAADARRANIDVTRGRPGVTMTANGPTQTWLVRINSIRVGDVVLNDVEAAVLAHDMPVALLGMSFLNRMEMTRDGSTMVLRKRF